MLGFQAAPRLFSGLGGARPGGAAVIKSAIVNLNKTTRPLRHCIQAQKQRINFICLSFRTIAIACPTIM